jgi:hypothetical protein
MGCVAAFFTLAICRITSAAVIYTYDFPSGSGLAIDQTNPQPSGATFSDFTRNNVNAVNHGDVFASVKWPSNGFIVSSDFVTFSISADAGQHLNLTNLTFSALIGSPTGPGNAQVALFLNGSATAYATFNFAPKTTLTAYNFDFTDLTDTTNATTATFKFFGWNAGGPAGSLDFDNVATFGAITNAPEPVVAWLPGLVACCAVTADWLRRKVFRARKDDTE